MAYDLIYCLLNYGDGPEDAGRHAAESAIAGHEQVLGALAILTPAFRICGQ